MNWTRWFDTVLALPTAAFLAVWGLVVFLVLVPFVVITGMCTTKANRILLGRWFEARIKAALGERQT